MYDLRRRGDGTVLGPRTETRSYDELQLPVEPVAERAAPLSKVVFSRKSDEWGTPMDLFRELDDRFSFDLDVAASDDNALCDYWFTAENSALEHEWGDYRTAFCNPPYSQCREFVAKCAEQAAKHRMTVVVLVPARTDTQWFHAHIYGKRGVSVDFLKGRLKFGDSTNSAPFPSMLVVFHGPCMERPTESARTVAAIDPHVRGSLFDPAREGL